MAYDQDSDRSQPQSSTADSSSHGAEAPKPGGRSIMRRLPRTTHQLGGWPAPGGAAGGGDDGHVDGATQAPSQPDADDPEAVAQRGFAGGGGPVPYKEEMEDAFGTSFDHVQAHTGGDAAEASEELDAEAYTVGDQIAFGSDSPPPDLVAHELTHVVQGGDGYSGGLSDPGDAAEIEADEVGQRVAAGGSAHDVTARHRGAAPAGRGPMRWSRGFGRAPGAAPPSTPWGQSSSSGRVYRKATQITALTVTPGELVADGTATAAAAATTDPAGKAITWSFDGASFGSTIDATGRITAGGSIAPATKSATAWVKARAAGGGTKKAPLTLWDQQYAQAKADFPKFIAGAYALPDYKPGNHGNFDALYLPAAKLLQATMRVKLDFTNDLSSDWEKFFQGMIGRFGGDAEAYAAAHGMWTTKDKADARKTFFDRVKTQWSDRYTFSNVREPQDIWGKLGPVHNNLAVSEVASGQHFTVTFHKNSKTAQVLRPNMDLYAGDLAVNPAFNPATATDERNRLQALLPTPIQFAVDKSEVPAADATKLTEAGVYMRRIHNPKFIIDIVGQSSKTGDSGHNQTLSEQRAQAAKDILVAAGATATHTVNSSGVGDTVATPDPLFQKADLTASVDPTFVNKQDVVAHEFGHMLGLGDEYGAAGTKASHWGLVDKAFGTDYANQTAIKGPNSASIMEGGDDVRAQHYVTFWEALVLASQKAATPVPAMGYADWKIDA